MAVRTFNTTAAQVREHYFPQLAAFSTSTTPTLATVESMVESEAAVLAGRLAAQSVSAATISDDGGATYPVAHAWCADTVRLGAAARVAWAMAGSNESSDTWSVELARRYGELSTIGYKALCDAPTPTGEPNGPRNHRSTHSLTQDASADMSDVVPRFRKSDSL